MGRLRNLASAVPSLGPRLARQTDAEGHSRDAEPWRAWYSTRRWRDLKAAVHLRDRFICQCGCAKLIQVDRERIADHIEPHRGDPRLFWDPRNVQTLWKPHHDRDKQRAERRAPYPGG